MPDDEDERDYVQEHKDGVAMGYITEDGSYREPPEPDWDAIAEAEHSWKAHGGGPCNCPEEPPGGDPWGPEPPGGYTDEPPF